MLRLGRARPIGAKRRPGLTVWTLLLALGCAAQRTEQGGVPSETRTSPKVAPSANPIAAPTATATVLGATAPRAAGGTQQQCREQPAQDFLLRHGQIAKIGAPAAERRAIEAARKRSIDYRTRQYGRFPGVGSAGDNPHPPRFYAKLTKFMGLPVLLNEKILPAVACVEAALLRECSQHPYRPRAVGGIRLDNTFKDYEVSNHVYGIAIDIDPDRNPCCNCVGNWREREACKKPVSSPFERMAMPKCWVDVFERYGFHWLGHDELEDTMHFEFLGDPERIMEPG